MEVRRDDRHTVSSKRVRKAKLKIITFAAILHRKRRIGWRRRMQQRRCCKLSRRSKAPEIPVDLSGEIHLIRFSYIHSLADVVFLRNANLMFHISSQFSNTRHSTLHPSTSQRVRLLLKPDKLSTPWQPVDKLATARGTTRRYSSHLYSAPCTA